MAACNRGVLLGLALVFVSACATTQTAATSPTPNANASKVPDFELNSVDGDTVRLSDHLGKEVVLLAFWDTWCEPCKTELPLLNRMHAKLKDKGFTVFAISMDDPSTAGQVAPYVHESGFGFTVLLDPSSKASNLYNTHKVAPYTVLIGRDGTIASEMSGFEPAAAPELEARVTELLAKQ